MSGLPFAAAFAPVDQHYLLEAGQMQALAFAVHIPLVAFAISFPAMPCRCSSPRWGSSSAAPPTPCVPARPAHVSRA